MYIFPYLYISNFWSKDQGKGSYPGILLAWINFSSGMDKSHMPSKVWDEITHPFPNFKVYAIEVWEWINYLIPHFIMDVITYPRWIKLDPCE